MHRNGSLAKLEKFSKTQEFHERHCPRIDTLSGKLRRQLTCSSPGVDVLVVALLQHYEKPQNLEPHLAIGTETYIINATGQTSLLTLGSSFKHHQVLVFPSLNRVTLGTWRPGRGLFFVSPKWLEPQIFSSARANWRKISS